METLCFIVKTKVLCLGFQKRRKLEISGYVTIPEQFNPNSRVCAVHFTEDCFLNLGAACQPGLDWDKKNQPWRNFLIQAAHQHHCHFYIYIHIYIYIYTVYILNKIINATLLFLPTFFMSWTQISKTFSMYTVGLFLSNIVHKSV